MRLAVATWNINSVRLRIDLLARFLAEHRPDVMCLQETKCPDDQFPLREVRGLGYEHVALNGQKGWHGVAVLSRRPIDGIDVRSFCGKTDCRHVAVTLGAAAGLAQPLTIHDFYVPAGGDEPDAAANPKFAHKLDFLDEVADWARLRDHANGERALVVGDLNVAPLEHDVWSHKQMLGVVSHTPVEVARLARWQASGAWVDVMRRQVPAHEKLYTWWSYRAADWAASDRGRRLDHVWASPALAEGFRGMRVERAMRGWPRPSDHVPVIAEFEV